MQVLEYFRQLRGSVNASTDDIAIPISIDEIAGIFFCTKRNAKLVLRRLEEEKWIQWVSGRGRGNKSKLKFLKTVDAVLYELSQQWVERGDLQKALEFMKQISGSNYRQHFFEWMETQFGYRNHGTNDTLFDSLRFPVFRKIGTLDPAITGCGIETHLVRQMCDCLVRYDAELKSFRPQIAHYWEHNEDHTIWTFYLRKGAYFHHGKEIRSEDVEFMWKRITDPMIDSPYRWLFEAVIQVKKVGQYCIQFHLTETNKMFLHHVAFHAASIIPADRSYDTQRFTTDQLIIGSGPFQLTYHDDVVYRFEANVNYYLGRPQIDQFEVWILEGLQKLELGREPDAFPLTYVRDTTTSIPTNWLHITKLEKGCKILVFNLNKVGPQRELRFRKMINELIDPLALIRQYPSDDLFQAYSLLPDVDESNPVPLQILQRSNGKFTYQDETIQLFCFEQHKRDAEWIQKQARTIGLNLDITIQSFDDRQSKDLWKEADLILYQTIFDDDTTFSILEAFQTKSSFLHICMDESMKEIKQNRLQELQHSDSEEDRSRVIRLFEQEMQQNLSFLYLYRKRHSYYFEPTLNGVTLSSLGWLQFRDVWVQTSKQSIL